MSRITNAIKASRVNSRNHRDLVRAISQAATPSMRDELLLLAQRQNFSR